MSRLLMTGVAFVLLTSIARAEQVDVESFVKQAVENALPAGYRLLAVNVRKTWIVSATINSSTPSDVAVLRELPARSEYWNCTDKDMPNSFEYKDEYRVGVTIKVTNGFSVTERQSFRVDLGPQNIIQVSMSVESANSVSFSEEKTKDQTETRSFAGHHDVNIPAGTRMVLLRNVKEYVQTVTGDGFAVVDAIYDAETAKGNTVIRPIPNGPGTRLSKTIPDANKRMVPFGLVVGNIFGKKDDVKFVASRLEQIDCASSDSSSTVKSKH